MKINKNNNKKILIKPNIMWEKDNVKNYTEYLIDKNRKYYEYKANYGKFEIDKYLSNLIIEYIPFEESDEYAFIQYKYSSNNEVMCELKICLNNDNVGVVVDYKEELSVIKELRGDEINKKVEEINSVSNKRFYLKSCLNANKFNL